MNRFRTSQILSIVLVTGLTLVGATSLANEQTLQFEECRKLGWLSLNFHNQGECVSVLATGGTIWDLGSEFRLYPDQENPNRDAAGNANIWWFLYNPTGLERDPAAYELLPNFSVIDSNREQWDDGDPEPPLVPFPDIGLIKHLDAMITHPAIRQSVVTGWRSPVEGTVLIRGEYRHIGDGGDGVAWYIERDNGREITPVASGTLDVGGQFELDLTADVQIGDFLHFSVSPCPETECTNHFSDSTLFDLTISGPISASH